MARSTATTLGVLALVGLAGTVGYWAGARTTDDSPTEGPARRASTAAAADPAQSPAPAEESELRFPHMKDRARSGAIRSMIRTEPAVKRFTFSWAVNPDGLYENKFLGVPAIQNPLDVWITQEIMSEIKPDFVVETGTLEGGSAALWATLLEQINPEAKVITIDIVDKVTAAKELPVVQRRVEFLVGSSVAPEIVDAVKRRVAGGKVMVILDSSHAEDHVFQELRAYAPIVSPDSYLIVQDTGMGVPRYERWPAVRTPEAGADRAVRRFMEGNREFETDRWRERLILTNNPGGYLKRVR
jgi:cephalosporin hydroxylase